MDTGIDLIKAERQSQIGKHDRSTEHDIARNGNNQLSAAASLLCSHDWGCMEEEDVINDHCPLNWDKAWWGRMVRKPYLERLVIAGALIAAEIDRLQYVEPF